MHQLKVIRSAVYTLLLLLSLTAVRAQDIEWQFTTVGFGIKPAIAIDASDTVHIAYIIEDMVGGVLYTSATNGTFIEEQRVATGYFYGPLDIAVTDDGIPFITYHDHQSPEVSLQVGDAIVATPFEGETLWRLTTIRDEGHDGWDGSIITDVDGNWHTVQIDPEQFQSEDGVEYATNAYSGHVTVESIGTGPVPYEFATGLDMLPDGTIGTSFYNQDRQMLQYAVRTPGANGTWTIENVDRDGDAGRFSSLVFDNDGFPHIAYLVYDGGSSGTIRHAWRNIDGVWRTEDIETLADLELGHYGARKITSLTTDSTGQLHLVFSDKSHIRYAIQGDDGWTITTIVEAGDLPLGQLVEFALDSSDNPHIVYNEITNTDPLEGNVIYATITQ